jgi:hypothetical protein
MTRKAGTPLSVEFAIAETDSFRKTVGKPHLSRLLDKIRTYVYPQLKMISFYGKNIVVVFDLVNRKDAY